MRAAFVIWENHDILGLFLFGLSLEVSGTGGDELGVFGEKRNHIEVRVVKNRILTILGIDGSQFSFILAIRLKYFSDGCFFVIKDVLG